MFSHIKARIDKSLFLSRWFSLHVFETTGLSALHLFNKRLVVSKVDQFTDDKPIIKQTSYTNTVCWNRTS